MNTADCTFLGGARGFCSILHSQFSSDCPSKLIGRASVNAAVSARGGDTSASAHTQTRNRENQCDQKTKRSALSWLVNLKASWSARSQTQVFGNPLHTNGPYTSMRLARLNADAMLLLATFTGWDGALWSWQTKGWGTRTPEVQLFLHTAPASIESQRTVEFVLSPTVQEKKCHHLFLQPWFGVSSSLLPSLHQGTTYSLPGVQLSFNWSEMFRGLC